MAKAIKAEGFQIRPLLDYASIDGYWQARAEALTRANLAKASVIPTWDGVFPDPIQEPEKEAPAWASQLLPANDPQRVEAKRKLFNHEQ